MKSVAYFQTSSASRYLAALCNHFGSRVKARCDANKGWVEFNFGRCDMIANESQLGFLAFADDQPRLDQVVEVITSHLERFAFRENPLLDWSEAPAETLQPDAND